MVNYEQGDVIKVEGIKMYFSFGGPYPMWGQYFITFTEGNKERNCVDFLSYHWEKITPKEWWNTNFGDWEGGSIRVYDDSESSYVYAGKKELAEQQHAPTELTMDNIAKACHEACKGDYCQIYMVFRSEV